MQRPNKGKPSFSPDQEAIADKYIRIIDEPHTIRDEFNFRNDHLLKINDIVPIENIIEVCCRVWSCNKETLFAKINHSDSLDRCMKGSFYSALFLFSNIQNKELRKLVGWRTGQLYIQSFTIIYEIRWRDRFKDECIKILTDLDKLNPNRIIRAFESYKSAGGATLERTKKASSRIENINNDDSNGYLLPKFSSLGIKNFFSN